MQRLQLFFGYESVNENLMNYLVIKIIQKKKKKKNGEELKTQFKNTFKFSNDISKLIFLLRKRLYPYKFMDDWEKFNETSLPKNGKFYSNLNMEDIVGSDYNHAKRICKDF